MLINPTWQQVGTITGAHNGRYKCVALQRYIMAQNANTTEEPDYSQLYVYAGENSPLLGDMTIYEHGLYRTLDIPVKAAIIGSSHLIEAGIGGYYEMTSCRPFEVYQESNPDIEHYNITEGIDEVLIREIGGYRIEITIQTREYNPPYDTDNWDLAYVFGPEESGAPTAIDFNGRGWETIHTYPEFDIELYTQTDFFPVD